jgi:metal-responsive CopG/Arc/MetJ family transcriptional regulator
MPAKRVLISIDERLLARVDERAQRLGIGRSTFLAQLADAELSGAQGAGADPAVRAALREIDRLFGADA